MPKMDSEYGPPYLAIVHRTGHNHDSFVRVSNALGRLTDEVGPILCIDAEYGLDHLRTEILSGRVYAVVYLQDRPEDRIEDICGSSLPVNALPNLPHVMAIPPDIRREEIPVFAHRLAKLREPLFSSRAVEPSVNESPALVAGSIEVAPVVPSPPPAPQNERQTTRVRPSGQHCLTWAGAH